MNVYYLGLKESTVSHSNFFKDFVLVKPNKISSFPNFEEVLNQEVDYNKLETFVPICNFFDNSIEKICQIDSSAKFMLYNQAAIEHMKHKDKLICTNNLELIKMLNNKKETRAILKKEANCLKYFYTKGKDINFLKLCSLFNKNSGKFVVQELTGFAGIGTFLLTKESEKKILKQLDKKSTYAVSEFQENCVSVNNTFMICDKKIFIFDGSVQKILMKDELLYDGWSFEEYASMNKNIKQKILMQSTKIAEKLMKLGYVGIGGIDYILKDDEVFFMEINPRFQSSSEGLDEKLQKEGFCSVFEMQYLCFFEKERFESICKTFEKSVV